MLPGVTSRKAFSAPLACDVLVLGAGLAGLRAAWAARQAAPNLRVLIATPYACPSGSSFANRNNALGMQVPNDDQAPSFVSEALALAAPGVAFRPLVEALAEDAQARLTDLLGLGLSFRRDGAGQLRRYPGCFSTIPRAVIYDGLASAHKAFLAHTLGLGATVLTGVEAIGLQVQDGRISGAVFRTIRGGAPRFIRAGAVIAALGGPAPLFARRTCGPGTGLSYGLLAQAGARLINTPYLQFFWVNPKTLQFTNPADLPWKDVSPEILQARRLHCPTAYGYPDAAVDWRLLAQCGKNGVTRETDGFPPLTLAAHAGNGGALIDTQGRTSVPGLYACGECASGMHGANRLGGAMVLSALVFGARAGAAAAQEATDGQAPPPRGEPAVTEGPVSATFLRFLRRGMQRSALLAGEGAPPRERQHFVTQLTAMAAGQTLPTRQRLLALSALAILTPQP